MKIPHLILTVMASLTFPALAGPESGEKADAGRYAISIGHEGLYFLDTATGALWLKSPQGEWRRVESPVTGPPEKGPAAKPVLLDLPEDGTTMPMVQREQR